MNHYIGNPLQIRGAEQYILQNGRGDGMHFLYVRNGLGLEVWISLDRCADVSRVSFKGDNMGYFSPCGYVAPQYYDKTGTGFLNSFTAGFFTTCGLTAVGAPSTDCDGFAPMHGTVSNIPAELNAVLEDEEGITVKLTVRDCVIFGTKLCMKREYRFSYIENIFTVSDTVTNEADKALPYMIMYHCNMGYPLLDENSTVRIPNISFKARDERAQSQIASALIMEKPQPLYEECCYYYDVAEKGGKAYAGIFGNTVNKGVVLSYDKASLPCFTEWKMMGKTDYVLGLEPGNCNPDGRDVLRREGRLEFLEPEVSRTTAVTFTFTENKEEFENSF